MKRNELLDRIQGTEQWDVIIIGGGATGLGAAVDAAARGYRTLLLEAYDYAKGTSSRATKLVHGGVRYLEQGNVSLVYEALHERGRVLRNAPHLAKPLPFVIPSYSWWAQPFYGAGLTLYSLMAGRLGIGFSKLIGRQETLRLAPTIEPNGLRGGVVYYDGQFDDTRLAITLMLTLRDLGGTAINYAPVISLLKNSSDRVTGVRIRDTETGNEYEIKGRAIINATGVFADSIRSFDNKDAKEILSPSQGVHIILDKSFLPGDHAIMIPKTDDGRVLFAVPWHDRVILGTTDTPVHSVDLEPRAQEQEIEFLLSHAARYFVKDPTRADVLSIFAGLRPLVKQGDGENTAALSRDHTLMVSPSGLITIIGGKWTTYRRMGADTINKAIEVAGLTPVEERTKELHLHGYQQNPEPDPFGVYGSDANQLKVLLGSERGWAERLHPNLPYRVGEVIWGARYEQARTVEDVLARRTRSILLDARASKEIAPRVAELLAQELGRDEDWQKHQVAEYEALADGYLLS